jgi:hypothetical protein
MTQERRQPLPLGRYWLVVTSSPTAPNRLDNFRAWAAANPRRVAIDKAEAAGLTTNGAWFLFRVLKPTRFDQKQFGFPNIAGSDVQTASDTTERPPVPKPADIFQDMLTDLSDRLKAGAESSLGRAALVLGLLYLVTKASK